MYAMQFSPNKMCDKNLIIHKFSYKVVVPHTLLYENFRKSKTVPEIYWKLAYHRETCLQALFQIPG